MNQPNDWSKTPDEHLQESRMGVSAQKRYLRSSIAYLLVFGFLVWLGGWCINGLWMAYLEAMK